jgi:aspartokinase-like uncharacterized kinase
MRVLVCGGRDFYDQAAVFSALDDLEAKHGELVVIQGGASGADLVARNWCFRHQSRVRMINEPADWKAHGRAAGPIRNSLMLTEHKPDLVLAFPGGRGTADMVRKAEAAGVPVVKSLPSTTEGE